MSDMVTTTQNLSAGAMIASGPLAVIAQNATVISTISAVVFGLIAAGCAVWNAHSNHKRNTVNESSIIEKIIKRLNDNGDEKAAEAVRRISK